MRIFETQSQEDIFDKYFSYSKIKKLSERNMSLALPRHEHPESLNESPDNLGNVPFCKSVADFQRTETKIAIGRLFGGFLEDRNAHVGKLLSDANLQEAFLDDARNRRIIHEIGVFQAREQYQKNHPFLYALHGIVHNLNFFFSRKPEKDISGHIKDIRLQKLGSLIMQFHEHTTLRSDKNFDSEMFINESIARIQKLTNDMKKIAFHVSKNTVINDMEKQRASIQSVLEAHLALTSEDELSDEEKNEIRDKLKKALPTL